MDRRMLGLAGRTASRCGRTRFAWAALADGDSHEGLDLHSGFGTMINEALAALDWSWIKAAEERAVEQSQEQIPAPVLVDVMLKRAVEGIHKAGLIALAVSARVPGVDLPCGGIMWVLPDACQDVRLQASPMSYTQEGLCMWTEQGSWCAVADCPPSIMAAVASRAMEQEPERVLNSIFREAQERKIGALLAVADSTGVREGTGGAAYLAGGAEAILSL